ncbi:MAG: hypothetical protein ACRDBO_11460 [Lachnospiraceae bacterium]
MNRLIAISPILFDSKHYMPGDELPATGHVDEWIGNDAARWEEDTGGKPVPAKAKSVTAPVGLTGDAYPAAGAEPDLVGRVPSAKVRGAQPEPTKRGRKAND